MSGAAGEGLPPIKLTARGPNGVVLYSGPPNPQRSTGGLRVVPGSVSTVSHSGGLLAVVHEGAVTLYSTFTELEVCRLDTKNVIAVFFSPKDTYLTTLSRPDKEAGNADKNLKAWNISTGEPVLRLFQKNLYKEQWPCIQWSGDETMAYQQVTNAVNGYSSADFSGGVAKKLYLKNISKFAISPDASTAIVAYIPEVKSSPASVAVYSVASLPQSGTDAPTPLARRNFFRSSSADLNWSPTGSAVVVTAISEVDASNQSYYGEQKLHFMSADGSVEQAVPLQKDGPIHDVQWNPKGDHFIVVHGFMPAKVVLFDAKCKPTYDLGSGPYGMAAWNHQGRFLALGGFGNLSGDLMFLDKKADSKCKPIANVKARDTVTAEWSPCGRYFLTATTAPRLRVDNGFRIFKYDGTLIYEEKMEVLLEAKWIPAPQDFFPDRPQSPKASGQAAAPKPASLAPVPQEKGYVPPHLRAAGKTASTSGHFSLAYDANDSKMGRPGSARGSSAANLPPGAAPPDTKSASKNAKRRNRGSKKAEGEAKGAPVAEMAAASIAESQPATNAANGADGAAAAAAASEPAKRVKNLKKKLSQIQQLKDKMAKEGEGAMDPDQIKKIATEEQIRQEIVDLGGDP